jgi:FkbM family methyltransferase
MGYDPRLACHDQLREAYLRTLNFGDFDHIGPMIDPRKASLDVGANAGQFILKLAAASSRVVAIEPLRKYAPAAGVLPPNCTFCNCAVGERETEIDLKIPIIDGEPVDGLASFVDFEARGIKTCQTQRTRVERIDTIVERELGGMPVGFIKMDVEGWEDAALRGAEGTIRRDKPNLLIELWPYFMPDAGRRVEELGYRGYFYFENRIFSITAFRHAIHAAPEYGYDPRNLAAFRPELQVNNFFFVPI